MLEINVIEDEFESLSPTISDASGTGIAILARKFEDLRDLTDNILKRLGSLYDANPMISTDARRDGRVVMRRAEDMRRELDEVARSLNERAPRPSDEGESPARRLGRTAVKNVAEEMATAGTAVARVGMAIGDRVKSLSPSRGRRRQSPEREDRQDEAEMKPSTRLQPPSGRFEIIRPAGKQLDIGGGVPFLPPREFPRVEPVQDTASGEVAPSPEIPQPQPSRPRRTTTPARRAVSAAVDAALYAASSHLPKTARESAFLAVDAELAAKRARDEASRTTAGSPGRTLASMAARTADFAARRARTKAEHLGRPRAEPNEQPSSPTVSESPTEVREAPVKSSGPIARFLLRAADSPLAPLRPTKDIASPVPETPPEEVPVKRTTSPYVGLARTAGKNIAGAAASIRSVSAEAREAAGFAVGRMAKTTTDRTLGALTSAERRVRESVNSAGKSASETVEDVGESIGRTAKTIAVKVRDLSPSAKVREDIGLGVGRGAKILAGATAKTLRSASASAREAAEHAATSAGMILDSTRWKAEESMEALREKGKAIRSASAEARKTVSKLAGSAAVAVARTGRAAIRAGSAAVVKSFSPSSSVPLAPPPVGDPNFLTLLRSVQVLVEQTRITEARINEIITTGVVWEGNNSNIIHKWLEYAKDLGKLVVTASARFAAQNRIDPAVPSNLITRIDEAVLGIRVTLKEIDRGLDENSRHVETGLPPDIEAILAPIPGNLFTTMNLGTTPDAISAMTAVQPAITSIRDSVYTSMTTLSSPEFDFVVNFDTTVLWNVAAQAVRRPLMSLPDKLPPSPAVRDAIDEALNINNALRGIAVRASREEIKAPTKVEKKTLRERFPWLPGGGDKEPDVRVLSAPIDKAAEKLLEKSGLGQSAESVRLLKQRREGQIKNATPLDYVSDLTGSNGPPIFPLTSIVSLLPFVLTVNILLAVGETAGGAARLDTADIDRIRTIDSMREMVIVMSEAKRLLADNLEATFRASTYGYFVEPSGIKAIEGIFQVLTDLPVWTKKINSMNPTRDKEEDIIFTERAMLSTVTAMSNYCAVCNPGAGSVCDLVVEFNNPATTNLTRAEVLREMAMAAENAHQYSVLGKPLIALCDAVDLLLTNPNYVNVRRPTLDYSGSGSVKKSVNTAEDRLDESIDGIHKLLSGVDYSNPTRPLSQDLIEKIVINLDDIVRDLRAIQRASSSSLVETVANDFATALKQIKSRLDGKGTPSDDIWKEADRLSRDPSIITRLSVPGSPSSWTTAVSKLPQLYTDVAFIVQSKYKISVLGRRQPTSKNLPIGAGVKNIPGLDKLPPLVNKESLIKALGDTTGVDTARLAILGEAINRVYGTQITPTQVDYDAIAHGFEAASNIEDMQVELIFSALPILVDHLARKSISSTYPIGDIGAELYTSGLIIPTQDLGTALSEVLSRIPPGINLDSTRVANAIVDTARKTKTIPRIDELVKILITQVTIASLSSTATTVSPSVPSDFQERLAAALIRVGGRLPPAWTGITPI